MGLGRAPRRRTAVHTAAVAVLLLTLAAPAYAAPAAKPVQAYWHGTSWSVPTALNGRAKKNAAVRASTPCAIGVCTAQTTANKKGRWSLRLDAIVKPSTAALAITLTSGTETATKSLPITKPTANKPGKGTIMVIGDSLAVGTASALPAAIPGRRVTTQAVVGRSLAQGMAVFASTPLDSKIAVGVFSLFTNDDPSNVTGLTTQVAATLTRLGPNRCAVWFTIRRPAVNKITYQAANDALNAMAADPQWAGRLLVVPWYETVDADHDLLGKDRVHPTPAGYTTRAKLTAETIARCPVSP